MPILREHSWQRMVHRAKTLIGCAPVTVGVDWGSRVIKAVMLRTDGHQLSLHDFSLHPIVEESLHDRRSDTEIVEDIRKKNMIAFNSIGTCLSGPSVLMKDISLPVMSEEDLRGHLALELDRYIALDPQDVFWDVYHRESLPDGEPDQQEHFLVVAKKECVSRQVDVFSQCGMTIRFVDVDAFALVNLVTYNYGKEGTWLLTHIGPSGILMVVIVQGEPLYIQKVAYAETWYEDLLDRVLLPPSSLESNATLGTSESLLLGQFFQETYKSISEAVKSFSDHSTKAIDRGILLSGGYVLVPEMAETLAGSLSMPVQLLNPFQSIMVPQAIQQDPAFRKTASLMNVAMGVALRGALSHD